MNVVDRIRSIANGSPDNNDAPNPRYAPESPTETRVPVTPDGVDAIRARLEELPELIAEAQAEVSSVAVRQLHSAEVVQRYTEQAASGALQDANKLVQAIRKQRELSRESDEPHQRRLSQLLEEQRALNESLQLAERAAIQRAYHDAVHAYCAAARDLPALTRRIRDAAVAAMIQITPTNSPGLLYDDILINSALITLSSPMYQHASAQA